MFTGIIEGFGTITGIQAAGLGRRFQITADFDLKESKLGDSVAVNGACLTIVTLQGRTFEVDVSPETLALTTHGQAQKGERVNLERALRLSDRLDGHLVSGHIDGKGVITAKKSLANAMIVTIGVPETLSRYLIKKGSVSVDGISLTINQCHGDGFEVSIIPHTAKLTTIGIKSAGTPVNIETDLIGKFVERFVKVNLGQENETKASEPSGLNMDVLARAGFLE